MNIYFNSDWIKWVFMGQTLWSACPDCVPCSWTMVRLVFCLESHWWWPLLKTHFRVFLTTTAAEFVWYLNFNKTFKWPASQSENFLGHHLCATAKQHFRIVLNVAAYDILYLLLLKSQLYSVCTAIYSLAHHCILCDLQFPCVIFFRCWIPLRVQTTHCQAAVNR